MSITSCGSPSKKTTGNISTIIGVSDTVRKSRSQDKLDNTFSRSRSSSLSSLENSSNEAVTCLAFADSYIRKSDPSLALPTMWLGTSLGAVLTVSLSIPEQESRKSEAAQTSLTGPMFRLKGSVLSMSLLDCNGALIPYPFETWRDDVKEAKRDKTPTKTTNKISPTNPDALCDRQFIVIASDKQAGVFALPSQNCVYKKTIVESDFVVKAEIISMREENNRLPFLDMLLVRHDDQHISTEWYQKPIASGRFLNYFSAHPPHQKINMAINFISRVNRLSTGLSESAKVNIMDQHLKLNDYPKTLRHRLINQRNYRSTEQHSSNQSPSEHLEYTYRSIAYIPYLTDKINSVCLISFASNGRLLVFSLPSLRLLLEVDFLPLTELSFQTKCKQGMVDPMLSIWGQQLIVNEDTNMISKTFSFSNKGHGLYLVTPTEIQKFTVCQEFCNQYNEMMGELYVEHEMPEAPKESFFKGLFGGGARNLDREELFGESSGKANKSIAKHIPGSNTSIQDLNTRATSASSEVSKAHLLMLERGDKLSQLEERTERMTSEAQQFSTSAHLLMNKYKDKKWYQL
ncbi:syntaxin-binding protein 5 isoform X2 [Wyeomyia smithii]|uniref:syntaxin-binding protein 5 isoform X2 n=1 Tax=Wyeomyia smithii TaxID=174621 RepID=UPI0024681EE1|nr:syntaxin-binding protein 5 isoform X2 [Wyeomyia smithii]